MQGDDDLPYSTVDSAHREIVRVLRDRVAGRERPAGQWVVTGDGDRIRVLLPPGYGDVAEELRSRFGERVICEEADVRMRYTERPGDTPYLPSIGSLAWRREIGHSVRVTHNADRLVTVVFTVLNLDRAVKLYTDAFGLDFHVDDHHGDDPWTSGRHAATSWTDGEYMHFALYETKDGTSTRGAQIAFRVDDLDAAHDRAVAAGAQVLHGPKRQPWGTSARYQDADGNVIELTQHG